MAASMVHGVILVFTGFIFAGKWKWNSDRQ